MSGTLKTELILAAVLLAFGLIALPSAIFFVGTLIIGPYDGGTSAIDLGLAVWAGLAQLEWSAWLLVLSPYIVVQLLRTAVRAARPRRRHVNTVTE
jgi:hypothetical protein